MVTLMDQLNDQLALIKMRADNLRNAYMDYGAGSDNTLLAIAALNECRHNISGIMLAMASEASKVVANHA